MRIVIEGAGEVGSHLAKMLSQEANEITVIDNDSAKLEKLKMTADVVTITGNPSSISILREAGVPNADLFISVNPGSAQDINIVSALIAKNLGAKKVTARVNDEEYLTADNKLLFKQMGIELMFFPEKIAADEISSMLRHGGSTDSIDFAHGRLQMAVFKVEDDSPILEMKLAEFTAALSTDELQFRVVAIAHEGVTTMPEANYKFRFHDLVYIMTTREGMEGVMTFLGKSNVNINKAMILGGGRIGEMVARQLSKDIEDIKIIEIDKNKCLRLSERLNLDNVTIVNGDSRNTDFLAEENISDYDAFLALTGHDELNVLSCVVAKKFGVEKTIAEVENIEYIRLAEEMGVDAVINKKLITAGKIFKFTLSDKARSVHYMGGTSAEVLEYTAAPDSKITKGALKDINIPRKAVIGGVIRGSNAFIPVGDSVIEAYDRVEVFALPEEAKEVDRFFR